MILKANTNKSNKYLNRIRNNSENYRPQIND
ncbi:MAG: hypothetical protein ACI9IP_003249 [Arcticibacterium sp.]|jgi:hypothetical protein